MIEEHLFTFFIDFSLIMLPISIVVSRERGLKKALNRLGFRKAPIKGVLKSSVKLFLAMIAVSLWISLAAIFLNINDLELVSQTMQQAKAAVPLLFWFITVRVVSEEIFFRGFLVEKIGPVASSAVFALFHLGYGSVTEIVGAFILGLVLAKALQLNKNLYPNIFAHIAYNAVALFALV